MTKFTRRQFIITAGAATATSLLAHGCSSGPTSTSSASNTQSANISPADTPEVTTAKLGFIALTDAAPLIIAKEKGLFEKYGMKDVEVVKQASWPVTRDNIELGSASGGIDGAHILSPMPYLMSLGKITKQPVPMYILARLNTNGQAISVANTYKDMKVGLDSKPLKEAFSKAKSSGKELKAAITFPGGTHDLWMRYWLAAGGINPDTDISTIPVPPPQMVANMKVGGMEAFCVGEPWNAQLVNQKEGYTALITGELWKDHPEKALSMRADWVDKNPKAAKAILMAVQEAQQWCDKAENKDEMVKIVSKRQWFKVPEKDIIERSKGNVDYGDGRTEQNSPLLMKFWADNASYPFKSHDAWFITENIRWGYLPANTDIKGIIDKVNREDLWKEAAKAIGVAAADIPTSTSRGVETFFDGVKFDPEDTAGYLKSLKIKKA
ncbi:MAG: ABC transporter substrate-binding protein [Symplocastrum torsivum CPER-KK1]|jgi:nitrate/nitrite transport system substrate-binding protein|uniref:ABC transporter substrate-binding protein n=1 Tax=Symplocastrum torsivum CPER-KK1 TaxID=450513 RepID=A0A951PLB0_9CYAN|nr:ABC transporter substrate-binding protein [Symplocastrum torsivum CPER-KK1]